MIRGRGGGSIFPYQPQGIDGGCNTEDDPDTEEDGNIVEDQGREEVPELMEGEVDDDRENKKASGDEETAIE